LNAVYLTRQLAGFRDGSRANSVMGPIAKLLDDADTHALATYFSSLAPGTGQSYVANTSATAMQAGERLATDGRWNQGLPPCSECHGRKGLGVGSLVPGLAGQPAQYLVNQLKAWQSGTRHDDPLGLMLGVSKKLTTQEISDVADYYASLPASEAHQGVIR